jgi:hypothetical protein
MDGLLALVLAKKHAESLAFGGAAPAETDPVYTADKPLIALKTELPDISGKANKSEVAAVQAGVDGIKQLIPTQASPDNQLADINRVNSSVSNMAARYVTATSAGDTQFESLAALNTGQWFHQGAAYTPTVHDYAIFINTDNSVWRAGFDGAQWNAQYKINDTPFTAAQIQAINSGITSGLVTQMQELINNPPGGGGGVQLYQHYININVAYGSYLYMTILNSSEAPFDTVRKINDYIINFLNTTGEGNAAYNDGCPISGCYKYAGKYYTAIAILKSYSVDTELCVTAIIENSMIQPNFYPNYIVDYVINP